MVFWLIGLGLGDQDDITVKGLRVVRSCARVYLEAYTSVLGVDKAQLEATFGRPIITADRTLVEQGAEEILHNADQEDVALLVVGDPFGATTHSDLQLRAIQSGIECRVVHNASIMNAVGCCGLQLYRFGESISIVFFTDTWKPDSFYDKIVFNKRMDIKMKEQTTDNLLAGNDIFEPPRFMSVNVAINQLLEIEEIRGLGACLPSAPVIGLACVGQEGQCIRSGTMQECAQADFGPPLHCMVLPGDLHPMEAEWFAHFLCDGSAWTEGADRLDMTLLKQEPCVPTTSAAATGEASSAEGGADASAGGRRGRPVSRVDPKAALQRVRERQQQGDGDEDESSSAEGEALGMMGFLDDDF